MRSDTELLVVSGGANSMVGLSQGARIVANSEEHVFVI